MGMFDSSMVKLRCHSCGKEKLREVQTKEFFNILNVYRKGDVIEAAPPGEFWLEETWWCWDCEEEGKEKNQYRHKIFLRFIDGLFLGAYNRKEFEAQREKTLDTYQIMRRLNRCALQGTKRRHLLKRIYRLIKNSQKRWEKAEEEEKEKPLLPTMLPESKDELLNRILEMIERIEEDGLKDSPPWA